MRFEWQIAAGEAGERLDRAVARGLRQHAKACSNRQAKALVEQGAVSVNGVICTFASHDVPAGAVLAVERGASAPAELLDIATAIIYRDEWLLAIDKPSGLPTHATHEPDRDHAQAAAQRLLGRDAYVAIHHRLDIETSGVLLFATSRAANGGLATAFAEREVEKVYAALVTSTELASGTIENRLGRDRHNSKIMRAVTTGGDLARTDVEVVRRGTAGAQVEARPATGRTHQIRVHLAGAGAPILGDLLYGGEPASRVMLHASSLALSHPVTGAPLELRAELATDFVLARNQLGL